MTNSNKEFPFPFLATAHASASQPNKPGTRLLHGMPLNPFPAYAYALGAKPFLYVKVPEISQSPTPLLPAGENGAGVRRILLGFDLGSGPVGGVFMVMQVW